MGFNLDYAAIGEAGDVAVLVGAEDLCSDRLQAFQHYGRGVAAAVVGVDGENGVTGMRGLEKGGRGGFFAAVMSHFEDVAGEGLSGTPHLIFRCGFGIAGEQKRDLAIFDTQHETAVVD